MQELKLVVGSAGRLWEWEHVIVDSKTPPVWDHNKQQGKKSTSVTRQQVKKWTSSQLVWGRDKLTTQQDFTSVHGTGQPNKSTWEVNMSRSQIMWQVNKSTSQHGNYSAINKPTSEITTRDKGHFPLHGRHLPESHCKSQCSRLFCGGVWRK
jgi:hypothetical protein